MPIASRRSALVALFLVSACSCNLWPVNPAVTIQFDSDNRYLYGWPYIWGSRSTLLTFEDDLHPEFSSQFALEKSLYSERDSTTVILNLILIAGVATLLLVFRPRDGAAARLQFSTAACFAAMVVVGLMLVGERAFEGRFQGEVAAMQGAFCWWCTFVAARDGIRSVGRRRFENGV